LKNLKKRTNLSLAKKVEAKVADFDIRGAVKLLSSDDSLASFNEDVAEELKKKHPSPSRELFFPDPFLLSGQLPSEICHLLYGASLCALNKKDGGLRPITNGNCLRRLTSKLACFQSRNIVNS
jgi:hypothetical protein